MVLKKDITPIGRGEVVKNKGKGSTQPPPRPMMDQLTRRYPKPQKAPPAPAFTPPFKEP